MPSIKRFEDLEAWKQARELTRAVYQITVTGSFQRDFGLRDQMRRAAVSVMANIAEGFERGGDKEFSQFLALAKGSAGEVRSHLYVALDIEYLTPEQFTQLYSLAESSSRLITGLMRYLAGAAYTTNKFKQAPTRAEEQ